MNAVLTDSGPLYASTDPDDSFHRRAREERERLQAEGVTTIVSYATLQEAHRLVLQKLGRTVAHAFLEDLLTTTPFIAPTDDDDYNAAKRVLSYSDQDTFLCGCALRRGQRKALAASVDVRPPLRSDAGFGLALGTSVDNKVCSPSPASERTV